MGKFEVRGGASSVRVEGDNWLAALGASLPHFGLDSSSMSRLSVDVAPSGLVTVRDPVSGSSFELEPVSEEPQQVKVPIALDPADPVVKRRAAAGNAKVMPPMSFGATMAMPISAPRRTNTVRTDAAASPPPRRGEPLAPPVQPAIPKPVAAPEPPPVASVAPEPPSLPEPPPVASVAPAPPSLPEPPPVASVAPEPPSLPEPPPVAPPAALVPEPTPVVEAAPPPPRPTPPQIPPAAIVEDDRPPELVEDLFDRCFDLSFEPHIGGACRKALEILQAVVPAEAGAVLYGGLAARELSFAAAFGPAAGALRGRTLPLDSGIAGFVHQRCINLVVNDVRSDQRHDKSVDEVSGYDTDSILAVSVRDDEGSSFGCIELLNPPVRFRDWHLEAAMVVARSLAQFVASRQ